ncbi:MAG: hypothetical protein U0X91_01585 [Spirosomataceae bacterium]
MPRNLNRIAFLALFSTLFLLGCQSAREENKPAQPAEKPVAAAVTVPAANQPASPQLKPFTLTFANLIENNRLHKLPVMSQKEIASYFVEGIDEGFADDYKYHLLEEVMHTPTYKMQLIAREYENENMVWLCLFDQNHKLLEAKEVYYDNAEGNYQVEAVLKNDTLTLSMDDINDGKYSEVYSFDKEFKLVPVKSPKK